MSSEPDWHAIADQYARDILGYTVQNVNLHEENERLKAQIESLNLAADQYSESRDKWYQEAKRLRDVIMAARFTLAMASQAGQPPLDCPRLRDVVRQAHETLKTVDKQ